MKLKKTNRGFQLAEFKDQHGLECSIQESSLATKACIWLGIDNPYVKVMGQPGEGWIDFPLPAGVQISSRMHLTQAMAKKLLPHLQKFIKTGYL